MPSNNVLRVATYNLMWNDIQREERLRAAAEFLDSALPDIVCVQESAATADGSMALTLATFAGFAHVSEHPPGERGTAILSRSRPDKVTFLHLSAHASAVVAEFEDLNGRPAIVISAHLEWGTAKEAERLAQARQIDAWIAERTPPDSGRNPGDPVVILCGDLNATPDSDTLRWLTGLSVSSGTSSQWTDTWRTARSEPGYTSELSSPWGFMTARSTGLHPEWGIPPRRIDYVLIKGYAHGRPGATRSAQIFGDRPSSSGVWASDHHAVLSELYW